MVRISHHDGVISLFDLFYRSNIVPNVVSYNTLILAHYEASRVDSALRAYREMLENATFSPSAVTYHHLTKGLVAAGCIQDDPSTSCARSSIAAAADQKGKFVLLEDFFYKDTM
ncbi:hypothetical protein GUJ93_ZPchr0010g10034 [Zizania palustris]|uniref:Pentatricopeptide repeat-containing protein n=1 Tax=Zizania palustris TaxID=103762 RepID=A0A8J5W857_ZIZPA|nr:hypothetical protein GUJ93_ZPchr0010g10034 [Zizania palustris]